MNILLGELKGFFEDVSKGSLKTVWGYYSQFDRGILGDLKGLFEDVLKLVFEDRLMSL